MSCPTGPGCDLSFHLLSLRLLRPTVLRSQPTTQQMSPDTATNTHTQSYVHYVTRTVHVVFHINTQVSVMRTQTVYNPTHGHTPPRHTQTQTYIDTFLAHTHTHAESQPVQTGFCFASYSVTFDPTINIKTQVSPGKHPSSHLCGHRTIHLTAKVGLF